MENSQRQDNRLELIIVGNGMATGRLLDELLKRGCTQFRITVIGDEPEGSYNRIMLSPVLAGETERATIIHKSPAWFAAQGINFIAGKRGTQIDKEKQIITLDDGQQLAYDQLVIATGSRPAAIPAKNQTLKNIFSFRTLVDVDTITAAARNAANAVVIGGGLLGLEAAYGLALKGVAVTVVHRSGWPLNRQLDATAGAMLQSVMAAKGVAFALSAEVASFEGDDTGAVEKILLHDGRELACDLAVIATGITPNQELGRDSGIACGRGIQVDALMQTSAANISALGECCEFEGATFGLVEPIWHQCVTLADRLCDNRHTPFRNPQVATKLKVSGVQLYSAGEYITRPEHREIVLHDCRHQVYRKLLLRGNTLVGVVLFGDTRDGNTYFEWLAAAQTLPAQVSTLSLGKSFLTESTPVQLPQAAAIP
ncbi:NAD(P)/FAD-dependent oxidoreductase [Teredinibacter turnerae]|uniref:NAD(P)/FAD-dependent oxidoreductase n=1 Tax=Teredinibacter turnerae TaxID=2426 RepID=UPI0005F781A6|nr:FAD-dependent oxidoreductase [Teredinibacter turnerae]